MSYPEDSYQVTPDNDASMAFLEDYPWTEQMGPQPLLSARQLQDNSSRSLQVGNQVKSKCQR